MDAALASEIMQGLREIIAKPILDVLNRLTSRAAVNGFEREMRDIARDTPFRLLGAGNFSAVFEHQAYPDYAFKLGFRAEDSGAMYAAWCRDNKLPHTPLIIHMDRWPEVYMVCMPKYMPSHDHPNYRDGISEVMGCIIEGELTRWADKDIYDELCCTSLGDTCRAIGKFFKGVARIDMHSGNWMWDTDGNIVITDPVSFSLQKEAPKHVRMVHHDFNIEAFQYISKHVAATSPYLKPLGFVENGGTAHLKAVQAIAKVKPSGLMQRIINRIKGEVNA